MKRKNRNDYWVGRFAVEMASALAALESGDAELAKMGLKETMQEYMPEADSAIVEFLESMEYSRTQLTPVTIAYRDESVPTGQEIASRL